MPLTLVKETGAGQANANSYADVADGDAYHEAHVSASAWTGASTATKTSALVMATRLIDVHFQFYGYKSVDGQALQWPRYDVPDPDKENTEYDAEQVPKVLVDATCELARSLIASDRTGDPDGEGISEFRIEGAIQVKFNPDDRRPVLPDVVQSMLSKLGTYGEGSMGAARLIRV